VLIYNRFLDERHVSGVVVAEEVVLESYIQMYLVRMLLFLLIFLCLIVTVADRLGYINPNWKGNRLTPFPNWFWWLNCPTQIIGLTSLLYIMSSTGDKGSQQTNKKTEKGFKYKELKSAEVCPGLAHRTLSGAPGTPTLNCSSSGILEAAPL
jgi:hypothetical protein